MGGVFFFANALETADSQMNDWTGRAMWKRGSGGSKRKCHCHEWVGGTVLGTEATLSAQPHI